MLTSPQEILNSFDVLSPSDKQIVAAEILRRTAPWDAPPLSDEQLTEIAELSFLDLEAREASDASPGAR
jgi:hypothetical protein